MELLPCLKLTAKDAKAPENNRTGRRSFSFWDPETFQGRAVNVRGAYVFIRPVISSKGGNPTGCLSQKAAMFGDFSIKV